MIKIGKHSFNKENLTGKTFDEAKKEFPHIKESIIRKAIKEANPKKHIPKKEAEKK